MNLWCSGRIEINLAESVRRLCTAQDQGKQTLYRNNSSRAILTNGTCVVVITVNYRRLFKATSRSFITSHNSVALVAVFTGFRSVDTEIIQRPRGIACVNRTLTISRRKATREKDVSVAHTKRKFWMINYNTHLDTVIAHRSSALYLHTSTGVANMLSKTRVELCTVFIHCTSKILLILAASCEITESLIFGRIRCSSSYFASF
jgi:hypothetical protein